MSSFAKGRSSTRFLRALPLLVLGAVVAFYGELARAQGGGRHVMRLKPASFPKISAAIRHDLEARGCEIPQTYMDTTPSNIIQGRFTAANRLDTGVLCSMHGVSTILVFRGGATNSIAEVEPMGDDIFFQDFDGLGTMGFSRAINVADPRHIRRHQTEFGSTAPSILDHDGIEDSFIEKGSTIHYWYRGTWITLQGSN